MQNDRAACNPGAAAALEHRREPPRRFDDAGRYLLSVRGAFSSMTHGQKFWGLRSVAAFLITVIFMILLQLGYMADRPL